MGAAGDRRVRRGPARSTGPPAFPPADTPLPPRFLGHWDQALLAYADRERIIPPELHPLAATVSGEPTFTVDGRVAGTWNVREGVLAVMPLVESTRAQQAAVKEEARRTARFCGAQGPSNDKSRLAAACIDLYRQLARRT